MIRGAYRQTVREKWSEAVRSWRESKTDQQTDRQSAENKEENV